MNHILKSFRVAVDACKLPAVVISFCVGGWLFWRLVAMFLWACYRAGIPM